MSHVAWKPGTMIYPLPAALVSCGGSEEEYERGVTVPLCTVATGRAQSMFGNAIIRIATGQGMHSGVVSIVGNGDGTETVFVKFATKGLQIFVR